MDEVLIRKAESIERCVMRIREDFAKTDGNLTKDITIQDAIILNLQRACQTAINGANRLVKTRKMGIASSAGDSFNLLYQNNIIDESLYNNMLSMVGFRNLSIHEYEKINLDILDSIIKKHVGDLLSFAKMLIDQA